MALNSRQRLLRRDRWIKMAVFLGVLGTFTLIIFRVENMLLSFVLASIITYLVGPWVNSLERQGIARIYAVIGSFLFMSAGLAILISIATPFLREQIRSLQSELPRYIEGTTLLLMELEDKIEIMSGGFTDVSLSDQAQGLMVSWTTSLFEDLPTFLSKSLTTIMLAPFFAFFILKDGRVFVKSLLALVPNSVFELTLNLQHQINDQMAQFVRARLLEAGIVGAVCWAGLAMFGFPYATLLAAFAALMNLIPYVGPIIGAAPAIIIALINSDISYGVPVVISVYSVAQLIDIVFIIPLVVAKLVDLHPVTVIVVIIIGAQLLGVLGMLISIPVASALKVTFTSVYNHLTEFRA